jgi:hypothetical protein
MFIHKIEQDKYGKSQTHYWLTQGDSCGILSTPKDSSGNQVDLALIASCKFKLYDIDTLEVKYEKEMTAYNATQYLFKMRSEENVFDLGKYKYEIEYTFVDGDVNTTNQWYFEIIEQSIGE